jgi:hypothetical protein
MLLDFKKPPYEILERCVSYTGKYMGFYGTHFHKGIICYVVGVVNKQDNTITARHYNENKSVNEAHAKAACIKAWQQFSAGLVRKPNDQDADADASRQVNQWFDVYEQRIREGVLKRSRKIQ